MPDQPLPDPQPELPHVISGREAEAAVVRACGGKVAALAAQPDEPGHVTAGREAESAVAAAGPH